MRSANRRLERAEQQLAGLPMSPAEREALLDRLELRYTALLDRRLRLVHQVATEAGEETGLYEPPVPSEKDIEELRAHRRRWDLPRASERHPGRGFTQSLVPAS